jgi:septum formation protein
VRPIVLASSSPYRRELLARLHLNFAVDPPDVDESADAGESPEATALRLARTKAHAVAQRHRGALVIASDQVAELDGEKIGKPGAFDAALAQLERMQGRLVVFHTALAVLDTTTHTLQVENVPTRVRFRTLPRSVLEAYLRLDAPFDCAGAAKIESVGIALVESVDSTDPTALIGLPLIRLTTMLTACGVDVPPR